jgi:hypothetical protein
MIEETEYQPGWKFLRYIDGALWSEVGSQQWESFGRLYSVHGRIKFCRNGYGCSPSIAQAMAYVWGEAVAEVEGNGTSDYEADRCVHREMRVNRAWRWTPQETADLLTFAADEVSTLLSETPITASHCDVIKRGRDRIESGKFIVPSHLHSAAEIASGYANAALKSSPVHNPSGELPTGQLNQIPDSYSAGWYAAYVACAGSNSQASQFSNGFYIASAVVDSPEELRRDMMNSIGGRAHQLVRSCPEVSLDTPGQELHGAVAGAL